jgi:hypothetical protein
MLKLARVASQKDQAALTAVGGSLYAEQVVVSFIHQPGSGAVVGGHAGSGNHCSNPEFSEYWVSQCCPTGAFVHDRVPSSRYKSSAVSEFQEILFLKIISAVIVGETRHSFVERDHSPLAEAAASC